MTAHFALIRANFYEKIAGDMTIAATEALEEKGYQFTIIDVPGCFELPAAVQLAITTKRFDGYITLGCVIRGETTHYDYVCLESARGLNELAMQGHAIGYGVITAEDRAQAEARADKNQKNVGGKSARAAIAMYELQQQLASS